MGRVKGATPDQLDDGIHPGDAGHAAMADAIGPAVAAALESATSSPD